MPSRSAVAPGVAALLKGWEPRQPAARAVFRAVLADETGKNGAGGAGAELGAELGAVYERTLSDRGARRGSGSFYTPIGLACGLMRAAVAAAGGLEQGERGPDRVVGRAWPVVDPACGCGAMLVAAARAFGPDGGEAEARAGWIRATLFGVERDAEAAELARVALWLEAPGAGWTPDDLRANIVAADALAGEPAREAWGLAAGSAWRERFSAVFAGEPGDGFGLVVGNPPFLNQLERATARDRAAASALRARFGGLVRGYADVSAAFLLLAVELLKPGGRAVMIQPQSLLAARHAGPVRAALEREAVLEGLWLGDERVFAGASVFTCAPVLARVAGPTPRRPVAIFRGAAVTRAADAEWPEARPGAAATWAPLAAGARGLPRVELAPGPTLGTLAGVSADFRDEYYGLRAALVDDAEVPAGVAGAARERRYPRLITSGAIDPARSRWGERPSRVLKRRWAAPRVDREALMRTELAGWLRARSVAKLLVATQTRVIEVLPDAAGTMLPCTPVLTVVPRRGADLWRVAAALASPVATLVAARELAGAALSVEAVKLSASDARGLPLPSDRAAWDRGAVLFREAAGAATEPSRRAALRTFGEAMAGAYGLGPAAGRAVLAWWLGRLGATRDGREGRP